MSIIHDALKKVQQGLTSKDETMSNPTVTQTASGYIYETPPKIETLSQGSQQPLHQESPKLDKIKSIFILTCAVVITIASFLYVYQQCQNDIPKVHAFAQNSLRQLLHKRMSSTNKPLSEEESIPLAAFTVNPPSTGPKMSTPPASVTLNIHGIMSNGNSNVVLINDQVYEEGDTVEGAKIVKINLDSITIDNNGTERTIFVKN